jgi:hypothetical protein
MSYSNGIQSSYTITGVDFTSTAASDLTIAGPAGKTGRITGISCVLTTGVTVAASSVLVGTAADTDAYATLAVPVTAIGGILSSYTDGGIERLPADTAVVIGNGGGATAGVGNVTVNIEWS